MAIERIEAYVNRCDERSAAMEAFYGGIDIDVPAMGDYFRELSDAAFLFWFAFDHTLTDGSRVVDRILESSPIMTDGEARYLKQMRSTTMVPYEVLHVRPGVSVTLRRLGSPHEIEVREKTASKTLKRWDLVIARLSPLGPSGGPEIEMGLMHIPQLAKDEISQALQGDDIDLSADLDERARREEQLGAVFHQIWLSTIIAPRIPTPRTREGDPVVYVTTRYEVGDEQRVRAALQAEASLERDGDTWSWIADHSLLGTIKLSQSQLTFETHSEKRAERGRQLIESIAGDAISFLSKDCRDLKEEVEKAIRSGKRPEPPAEDEIPLEIKDRIFQEFMAKHNQQWLDDQLPALDQQTPRFAASSARLRPRLVELLKEMENQYLSALAAGKPAFDPTWMWDELSLSDHQDAPRERRRPLLAHESLEQQLPGISEAVRTLVDRKRPDQSGLVRTGVTQDELRAAPPIRELIKNLAGQLTSDELIAHLEFYSNYEMQRRKTFWVDESLAWMLANTQVDSEGSLLRLPFPSYVVVYTDRHMLGLAERALASDPQLPLRGQMLSVLCAYVVDLTLDSSRLKVGVTFDACAGQPPHLMSWELHINQNAPLEQSVGDALARAQLPASGMFRPLLDAVINATLYTTSAGVRIEQYRVDSNKRPIANDPDAMLPSGSVYHLPGKINISHMRKLQQVARGPSGRTLMHRFMVRGHWRRPNSNWKEQALRWIGPYWRGPSLASIVEREYRLNP